MRSVLTLGIDTSNYTTSVAIVDGEGRLLADERKLLTVKKGERGLRQQDAVWQHIQNLPDLVTAAFAKVPEGSEITCVSVSTRPRRQEGSYMPVFEAGRSLAQSLAAVRGVPCHTFSHQEGHLAAALWNLQMPLRFEGKVYGFHLSGGTLELLEVATCEKAKGFVYDSTIIGGSHDISFGQVLDRVGVALGYDFPAGAALDAIACENDPDHQLTKITVKDRWIHLSGLESQCQRRIEKGAEEKALIAETFARIKDAILGMTKELSPVVLMGGVAESRYLRNALRGEQYLFPANQYGRDNAVGIALLGSAQQ